MGKIMQNKQSKIKVKITQNKIAILGIQVNDLIHVQEPIMNGKFLF